MPRFHGSLRNARLFVHPRLDGFFACHWFSPNWPVRLTGALHWIFRICPNSYSPSDFVTRIQETDGDISSRQSWFVKLLSAGHNAHHVENCGRTQFYNRSGKTNDVKNEIADPMSINQLARFFGYAVLLKPIGRSVSPLQNLWHCSTKPGPAASAFLHLLGRQVSDSVQFF